MDSALSPNDLEMDRRFHDLCPARFPTVGIRRPRNKSAYEEPDAPALAAAYLWAVIRNMPFLDGNQRTAWVVARTFLILNGRDLQYTQTELVEMVRAAAAGTISEVDAAAWFRQRLIPPL
jgi:death-on-curing protein